MDLVQKIVVWYSIFCATIIFSVSEFYFVRHGQTDFNAGKESVYWDMSINNVGKKQVESLKDIVQALPIEVIYFSSLKRAVATKNILHQVLNVADIKLQEIKEAKKGLFNELQAIKNKDKKHVLISKRLQAFLDKVSRGIDKILANPYISLVIGHGTVYSAICYILDVKTDMWKINNATLVHFYQKPDGHWTVDLLKDGSKV